MSFLSKFESWFMKLFGSAPAWIHIAQTVVTFAAPVATAVITGFAPELLPVALPIMAEVQADLATVAVLTSEGTASPSLTGAIDRIQTNLGDLMTAGHIKDTALQAQVTLVVSELKALASMLPPSAAVVATPTVS